MWVVGVPTYSSPSECSDLFSALFGLVKSEVMMFHKYTRPVLKMQ